MEPGRKFFFEKFGVTPTVATNYDAFGGSIGLVQILKNCGYRGMLVCRPNGQTQFDYPVEKTPVAKRSVRGRGISRRLIDYRFKILKQSELNSQELGSGFSFST